MYLASRMLQLLPTLLFVTIATFLMLRLIPGDPALIILGPNATPERLAEIHAVFGSGQATLAAVFRRAKQALQAYSVRLEDMVAERTQELRDAHELRNPLGVITNAIYLLNMTPGDDETNREYLDIIERQARAAEGIISDLFDFACTREPERTHTDMQTLVAEALDRRPPPENVTVTVAIPADLPPVFVDPRQIEQVLANLVINAYQAMSDGGELTISVEREEGDEKTRRQGDKEQGRAAPGHLLPLSSHLRVLVGDTGMGISPENMARLFEPLFTTKLRGIGLGLAISKRLVEANGGIIRVTSVEGEGSTFTVILPTKEVAP